VIRLAHLGDLHLTEGPRFDTTAQCLEYAVLDGIAQGVNLWAVVGDLSGTTVPHRATIQEKNTLGHLFQAMAEHAPVVVLYGNHDSEDDLELYGELKGQHEIHVVDRPSIVGLDAVEHPVIAYCLPFPQKRHYLTEFEGSIEDQKKAVEDKIRGILAEWSEDAKRWRDKGVPTVLLYHGAIIGCLVAGGEVMMPAGQEIEFSVEELESYGFDYVGASHIHVRQQLGRRTWYAGSPDRSNFSETDSKGYLVVDAAPGQDPVVHVRLTPARRFVTVEATWSTTDAVFQWNDKIEHVAGAEVRMLLTLDEDAVAACPVRDAEAFLQERGAFSVKVERRIIPRQRIRSAEIAQAQTLAEKLEALWATQGDAAPTEEHRRRCLEKLQTLEGGV
jgi:DNA repair exonuclease SbcCD nuclease subunit